MSIVIIYAEDTDRHNTILLEEYAIPPEYKGGAKRLLNDLAIVQSSFPCCQQMTGRVLLSCLISKDGFIIVDSIKVLDSMTPAYDQASIEAVKKLGQFSPGRNWNGEIDDCWLTIPVRWPPRKPGELVSLARGPKYIGNMYEEIDKNIQPDGSGARGRVVVKFLVGKDGYIKHETIEVRHGMSEYYDHAVVEAVKKLGKFEPGKDERGEFADRWYPISVVIGDRQQTNK